MERVPTSHVRTDREVYDDKNILLHTEVTYAPRKESSIQFKTDSKGVTSPTIKVYHEDPEQAFKMAKRLLDEANAYLDGKE